MREIPISKHNAINTGTENIMESIGQGLIKLNHKGHITYANMTAYQLLKSVPEILIDSHIDQWFRFEDSTQATHYSILSRIEAALDQSPNMDNGYQEKAYASPILAPQFTVEITCSNLAMTSPTERLILFQDISQRQAFETELKYLANFDSMTKLPNRTYFNQALTQALESNKKDKHPLYLFMLGLDGFKEINDTLGHNIGDQVLISVAERLQKILPKDSLIARFGGDEFALLSSKFTHNEAQLLAQELIQFIALPFSIFDNEIYIETSIGIADSDISKADKSTLLRFADIALSEAKLAGKNGYKIFAPEMAHKKSEEAKIKQTLRQILENQDLIVHYQPQYNVIQGDFIGFEALARWPESEYGKQVSPAIFIPLAEQNQLIHIIGEQVLIQSCEQLAFWHARNPNCHFTISVNLSAKQLNHPLFLERLKAILLNYHFPLERLVFEITETAILGNFESIIHSIQTIKDMGIRLALDDFGTGYSSLNYLQKLPFDVIKIDQSFTQQLGQCKKTEALVKAIITIADACNMDVIAEGVESNMHHQHVVALGCNKIQGYYYSPALPQHLLEGYCESLKQLQ
ncbi:EAL domain-containing protein [Marinomonas sp. MED121]|uniref:sensor domain-containing protein n=1 Tax=Marinomonas sp. MED121 TaxID=314277 RepID=UPI000303D2C6|nr:EAL domain-containing protein [Marinomonas sp. MED121]